ncbi:hypothetical protein AN478_09415 [Thiohalorhabdus denitrificans]|uniref:Iron complex outermembrane recepter protein n=1 Tax=Thiohalorhabdus denitrificans TaxID=381306 RepID=A0A0P9EPB2_9GAMM|nr:TonB-dependent receptor [Thiohalorhabdus denitrificans]KPV40300.1 hypothetical protein AN478_09415 [Thiohalorhabdus denitrificans]SCX80692.1 iron complex outermembrane recepter protein [Thiohalorhabdus denitrificans]
MRPNRIRPRGARLRGTLLTTLGAFGAMASSQAADLGTIQVESSTIDDRFEDQRDRPSSVQSLDQEEVEKAQPQDIQEVLRRIPGVTTEKSGGSWVKIHMRGVDDQRYMGERPGVAVVIDGVPVFERTGRVNIDLDNIESIRVTKGGASYLYGDDALGGAVSITTKRGADEAGVRVEGETGSYGYRRYLGRAGLAGQSFNGHLQVSSRWADGYHDDADHRADYLNGKLQYYLDDWSDLTVGLEVADREKNSHGTVKGVTAAEEDPKSEDPAYNDYANHFDVRLRKYYLTYSRDLAGGGNLMATGYFYGDRTDFVSNPTDDDPDQYTYDNDYEQAQRGIKGEYRDSAGGLAWMVGTDLRSNYYENEVAYLVETTAWSGGGVTTYQPGELREDNRTDERVAAAYGELKVQPLEALTLTANGRWDRIDLEYRDHLEGADDGEERFGVPSGRLGANWAAGEDLDLYANVSTGFRAPTVEQLFVGSYSTTGTTAPNSDLDPEFAVNKEVGLRARATLAGVDWRGSLAAFQIDRDDYVMGTSGTYAGPESGEDGRYDNIGGARHRGLELAVNSDPERSVAVHVAYTYLETEFTDYDNFNLLVWDEDAGDYVVGETLDNTGNEIPRTPNHTLNAIVDWRPLPGLTLTAEGVYESSYYADEMNRVEIDGHELLHLRARYEFDGPGGTRWSLFGRLENALDEDYYNSVRGHRDTNEDGAYDAEDVSIAVNPGRTWSAGLKAEF